MKHHKIKLSMLRSRERQFWTTANFEIKYCLSEKTESVLTDADGFPSASVKLQVGCHSYVPK